MRVFVCVVVRLCACLFGVFGSCVGLPVCLVDCLFVWLPVCLFARLLVCLSDVLGLRECLRV